MRDLHYAQAHCTDRTDFHGMGKDLVHLLWCFMSSAPMTETPLGGALLTRAGLELSRGEAVRNDHI